MVQEKYLVVGGDGFLGHHLVQLLLQRTTADIVVLDIHQKHFQSEPRIEHKLGKIENFDEIVGAFQNITTVFHTASPGYAAKDEVLRATNIQGTENIIKSCQVHGVQRLVFTSSASVVFQGQDLYFVDESAPYPERYVDVYTDSKAQAEQMVLKADNPRGLRTCSIRPSAIIGPGDWQHIPTIAKAGSGLAPMIQLGSNRNLLDLTHVINVGHACVLAADKLIQTPELVGGEAFFVTNDSPIPFWDYPRNAWTVLGIQVPSKPTIVIPAPVVFLIIYLLEFYLTLIGLVKPVSFGVPFRMRQMLLCKCYNISKAKSVLGYQPIIALEEAISQMAEFYMKNREN